MRRTGGLFLALFLALPHLSAAGPEPPEPAKGSPPPTPARLIGTVAADGLYLLTAPLRLDRETALLVGGLTLGLAGLVLADREIRERVQAATGPTGRDVADAVSTAGDVGVLLGVNAALLVLGLAEQQGTGETRLRDASLVALEAHLIAALFTAGLKPLTGRARPDAERGAHHFDPFSGDDALPSSHASRAFAVAAVFADRYGGPVPFLAYGGAGLVAVSRVVLDRHWGSDVVAGAALGIAVGRGLSRRRAAGRRGLDFFPFVSEDGSLAMAVGVRF